MKTMFHLDQTERISSRMKLHSLATNAKLGVIV
jgi:hypothetical protein